MSKQNMEFDIFIEELENKDKSLYYDVAVYYAPGDYHSEEQSSAEILKIKLVNSYQSCYAACQDEGGKVVDLCFFSDESRQTIEQMVESDDKCRQAVDFWDYDGPDCEKERW